MRCRNYSWSPCYRWKRRGSRSQFPAGVPNHHSTTRSLMRFTGTQCKQRWPTSISNSQVLIASWPHWYSNGTRNESDVRLFHFWQGLFSGNKEREERRGQRKREEKLEHTAVITWALEIPASGFAFSSGPPCHIGKSCLPKPQRTQHSQVWMNENHCIANHLTNL